MLRSVNALMILLLLLWSSTLMAAPTIITPYSGGSGTAEDPYLLATPEDVIELAGNTSDYDKSFLMISNINMSGYSFDSAVIAGDTGDDSSFGGTAFTGTFDGGNFAIISLNVSGKYFCGLFGYLGTGANVSNLGLKNVNITGTGDFVGAVCGRKLSAEVSSCYAIGTVTGDDYVGGLCGQNWTGNITESFADVTVRGSDYVGGLCGIIYFDSINTCYSTGSVSGNKYVGGLCGYNSKTIDTCFAACEVTGEQYIGGICGYDYSGNIMACFWDNEIAGVEYGTGNNSGSGVDGLTTATMQTLSSFTDAGWDFVDETVNGTDDQWYMPEDDYPHLSWEQTNPPLKYSGGDGTEDDPYQISSAADLLELGETTDDYDKYFIMIADIDLADYVFDKAVIAWNIDGYFSSNDTAFVGTFNGNSHIITNLNISGTSYCGVFGHVGSGGVILNLGLENSYVAGTRDYSGGLCGYNEGSIISCSLSGDVNGMRFVGGICGYNDNGAVTFCYAAGNIIGSRGVGGVCGSSSGGITSCFSTGDIVGFDIAIDPGSGIGGVCGGNYGSIVNCYSNCSVTGSYIVYAGGLCGSNRGSISYCYASGMVSIDGNNIGGLCGYNYESSSEISNCFWDIDTTDQAIGCSTTTGVIINLIGLTTTEMQTLTTYTDAGWDFSVSDGDPVVWVMNNPGSEYPILAWQDGHFPVISEDIADDCIEVGSYYIGPIPVLEEASSADTWQLLSGPEGMIIDESTGQVSWQEAISAGIYTVRIKITNNYGSDTEAWTLSVLENPEISAISEDLIGDSVAYSFTPSLTTTSVGVSWLLSSAPSGMTINTSTGTVRWSAPISSEQPYTICVSAENCLGSDSECYSLTVMVLPEISDIDDVVISPFEGSYSFIPLLSSGDGEIIWSLLSAPEGMSIDAGTGEISWLEPVSSNDAYVVTVVAENAVGIDSVSYSITVMSPPAVADIADVDISDALEYSFTPSLSGGTGNITWSLTAAPDGMVIDASTGEITWAEPESSDEPYSVSVSAENSVGSSSVSYAITVMTPIAISDIADVIISDVESYTFTPSITSGTGDISWSLESSPEGMTIDPNVGDIIWLEPVSSDDAYVVTVTAANSICSMSVSYSVTVMTPPVIAAITDVIISDTETYEFKTFAGKW